MIAQIRGDKKAKENRHGIARGAEMYHLREDRSAHYIVTSRFDASVLAIFLSGITLHPAQLYMVTPAFVSELPNVLQKVHRRHNDEGEK